MLRRGLIITAVGVYLVIMLGCVFQSRSAADKGGANVGADDALSYPLAPLTGLPYRGVAMQIQRVDAMEHYKVALDEIAAFGADTVLLIVDARQENGTSVGIYLDLRTVPGPEGLGGLIDHAKMRKLRVILMPIVLISNPKGNEWRGTINPSSWAAWFDSYRSVLLHFTYIAANHKADVLVVGSELVSAESHADEWRKTIAEVRANFKGQLTYSSNWDHYSDIPFWDQLDMIGMNSYWTLDRSLDGESKKNRVSVPEVVNNWRKIQKDLKVFADRKKKPILLLEAGWCSLENAADEPWDYTRTDLRVDLDLQKRLWDGFFQAWHGTPWMAGFMIWAWEPGDAGPTDKGYGLKGKPSYDLVKGWLAKPWKNN